MRSTPSLPSEDLLCLVMSRCDRDLRQECLRVRLEWELNHGTSNGAGSNGAPSNGAPTNGALGSRPHIVEAQVLSWLSQSLRSKADQWGVAGEVGGNNCAKETARRSRQQHTYNNRIPIDSMTTPLRT